MTLLTVAGLGIAVGLGVNAWFLWLVVRQTRDLLTALVRIERAIEQYAPFRE